MKKFYMILDICSFIIDGSVKCFLGMGLSHVNTFPHSIWIKSQASLAVPIVATPRLATFVQLRVMCPHASWSEKTHLSIVGVDKW